MTRLPFSSPSVGCQPMRHFLQVQNACAEAARSTSGVQPGTPRPALGSKLVRAASDPKQMHINAFTFGMSKNKTGSMVVIRPNGAAHNGLESADAAEPGPTPSSGTPGASALSQTSAIVLNRPLVLPQAPPTPTPIPIPIPVTTTSIVEHAVQSPHVLDINHLGSEVSIVSTTPSTESASSTPSKSSLTPVQATAVSKASPRPEKSDATTAERKRVLPTGASILPSEIATSSKRARILVSPEYDEEDTTSTSDSGLGESNTCARLPNGNPESNRLPAAAGPNEPLQFTKAGSIGSVVSESSSGSQSPSAALKLANGVLKQNGNSSSSRAAAAVAGEQAMSRSAGEEPSSGAVSPAAVNDRQAPFGSLNDAASISSLSSCEFIVDLKATSAASVPSNSNADAVFRG